MFTFYTSVLITRGALTLTCLINRLLAESRSKTCEIKNYKLVKLLKFTVPFSLLFVVFLLRADIRDAVGIVALI